MIIEEACRKDDDLSEFYVFRDIASVKFKFKKNRTRLTMDMQAIGFVVALMRRAVTNGGGRTRRAGGDARYADPGSCIHHVAADLVQYLLQDKW